MEFNIVPWEQGFKSISPCLFALTSVLSSHIFLHFGTAGRGAGDASGLHIFDFPIPAMSFAGCIPAGLASVCH